jgi:hypothetical protein
VAVSSIIGDTLILVASRDRKSFKLNKFLVTIMQHIAVNDIILSVTFILPITISLIADSWIFGDVLCYAKGYTGIYFYPVNMSLICALTTSKFLLLRKQTRTKTLSRNKAHIMCFTIWAAGLLNLALICALGRHDFSFDYRTYDCEYGFTAYTWKKIKPVMFTISCIIPNVMIIATSLPTMKYLMAARNSARRVRVSAPWQGALTVVLTATVYCLSTFPCTVYMVGSSFVPEDPVAHDTFSFGLCRYGFFTGMVNITSNFFIYTLTITSFRRYLRSKIVDLFTSFKSWNTLSGTGDSVYISKTPGNIHQNRSISLTKRANVNSV